MKRTLWISLVLALGLLAACNQQASAPNPMAKAETPRVKITAAHDPETLVVGYENEADLEAILETLGGGKVKGQIPELKAALIELPPGLDAEHALGKLAAAKPAGLRYAEPNFLVFAPRPVEAAAPGVMGGGDPLEPQKWDHEVMQAEAAWQTKINGERPSGAGVVIAIVDTGIDGNHPDLSGKFVWGYDASGCLNQGTPGPIPPGADATEQKLYHGTHVAGIAAARGENGIGVRGVAPDALLMDIKVFCEASASYWTIAYGVYAAIADLDGDGVVPDVINMSLGGKGYHQLFKDVLSMALTGFNPYTGAALPGYDPNQDGIPEKSAVVVVAMGNSEMDEYHYPAGYPGIIAVGATNPYDEKTYFSTSGHHISVSAPGIEILSTWPTWARDASGRPYLYYRISGTSMATPQVAGAAALVKQFYPEATPYEVRRLIETTADDIGPPGFDRGTGWGRINLKRLVDAIATGTKPEPGGTAMVLVSAANFLDQDGDGVPETPVPIGAVDVQLVKDGLVRYLAKTDASGLATFFEIEPGTYRVLVAGQDITDWTTLALWPYERVSWDADGDPENGVTPGELEVKAGSSLLQPSLLFATLNTEKLEVEIRWIGGGDLDLAVYEFDPASGAYVWSTAKTGGLWGSFAADAASENSEVAERYTLNPLHYPAMRYRFSVDATRATTSALLTFTLRINGVEKSYGPIVIPAGSTPEENATRLANELKGFSNEVAVY